MSVQSAVKRKTAPEIRARKPCAQQPCVEFGRALQAQGKRDEARAAFRSASEHLQTTLGPDHPNTHIARQLAESDVLRQ